MICWIGGPAIVGARLDSPGFGSYRGTIRGAQALATHMAAIAQRLRDELLEMSEVELDDGRYRCLRVTGSPFPRDDRRCAVLEPICADVEP